MPPDTSIDSADFTNLTAGDLTDAVYGQVQSLIEQGRPDNVLFHYFLPGIPFGPELAAFMDLGPAPAQLDTTDEQGQQAFSGNDLVRSAVNFARIVDHVPAVGEIVARTTDKAGDAVVDLNALVSGGTTVSGVYEAVLNHCKVINNALTPEEEQLLVKLRSLLYKNPSATLDTGQPTPTEPTTPPAPPPPPGGPAPGSPVDGGTEFEIPDLDTNPAADAEAILGGGADIGDFVADASAVADLTPAMQTYELTRLAYEQVMDTELEKRRTISSDDPNAGALLAASNRRIEAALKRWEGLGQKNKIETIQAKIAQLSLGGMPLYVDNLRRRLAANKLQAAVIATASAGAAPVVEEAYYAALRPNGILRAPSLLKIAIDSSSTRSLSTMSAKSTSGKAGFLGMPLFASAAGNTTSEDLERRFFSEGFSISFEIVQGLVDRQWLDLAFLLSDAYTMVDPADKKSELDPVSKIVQLSDGQQPPGGVMPIIPMTVYFARDVTVKSTALKAMTQSEKDMLTGKGAVSFLGFGAAGQHSSKTTRVETSQLATSGELTMRGTFLVAVASRVLEKAPDPDFTGHPDPADWI